MKQYNFDQIIDRRETDAVKTDGMQELFGRTDLLPMWVADMDFAAPPFVTEALCRRMEHPIYGYSIVPEEHWNAIIDWIASHHQWNVLREWLTYIPGIVKGIGMAINAIVAPDEKIIIQPPVYHPFRLVSQGNNREVVYNPLRQNENGSYEMDFDNLERVTDEKCRLLILANPHNPAGIVWSRDTLKRLADFCYRRGIVVISDEIHCDMALWDNKHIPFASVSPEAAACSITFGAPSKTFNIAGIVSSYAIVPNAELRNKFYSWLSASELNSPNMFASIATIAAYRNGEEWRREMLHYVEENIDYVINFCSEHIPAIKPLRPQASFLIWLDCRGLGISHEEVVDMFVNKARLAMNDGAMFGEEGRCFMRMNIGTPRSVIEQAMQQLKMAVDEL